MVETPVIFLGRAMRTAVPIEGAPRPKPVRLARLGRIQHRVLGKNADTDRRW